MRERISRWGAPLTYLLAVVVIGTTLITILTRSPDTKSNYQDSPQGYTRTQLSEIGKAGSFDGLSRQLGSPGATIYVQAGCASCHGLNGEGGVVGPTIWKKNAEDLLDAVREGKGGMPEFHADWLTDEQVQKLAEYLRERRTAASATGARSNDR